MYKRQIRLGERDAQPIGQFLDLEAAERAADQCGELVAAEPGDGVPAADGALQPAGGLHQELVADLVPGGVVDRLEAVQVEEEHRDPGAGPALLAAGAEGGPQPLGEQRPVGQVGERVVEGVVLQLGLEHDAFGDVPAVEQQAVAVPADGGLDVQPLAAAGADPALHPGRGHGGARVAVGGEPHPGEVAADLGEHPVHVLGVDEVQQVAADEFLRVAPVDAERGRGDVGEHAVGAGDHDDVTGALHQGAEVRLLVGEFLGQRQVVEQHHALPEDQCQPDGAGGRGHHAVQPVCV